jgi:hypothetical protein
MKDEEVRELLYQALETELGGVQVYQTALRCVVNADLKKEWEEYLVLGLKLTAQEKADLVAFMRQL